MNPSILAVIVLYKTAPRESLSVVSLAQAISSLIPKRLRLQVVLIDNSPEASSAPGIFPDELYLHFPDNPGIAHAYNLGLRMAQEQGNAWLLTLDQDTSLPRSFLSEIETLAAPVDSDPQIAAIVPNIVASGRLLSPYTFRWAAIPSWFPAGYTGVPDEAVYALNSASLLRVSALRQAGGYDPRFWLDASDHAIFHALAANGKRVYVAGNIQVEHQLALLEDPGNISPDRYHNLLAAEEAFWDLYMSRPAMWERNARLAAGLLHQLRRGSKALAQISIQHLAMRLLRSRRYRIRAWQRGLEKRPKRQSPALSSNIKVSVCMASYNGERYIDEQIASILPQLRQQDELIVVDDASTDRSRERIRAIADPRIRLIPQEKNLGVVPTFEHAVRSATGDILFLCDGDDIWAPDKVDKVLQAFRENPGARVVCTGLTLIDANGKPLRGSEYMKKREFTAALFPNLLRNRFQGSAMALRSSLLAEVLPFPRGRAFLHDAWIGACNTLTGGGTAYVEEPLLYYRRHSNNISQPMQVAEQFKKRLQLTLALLAHWLRKRRPSK